MLEDAAFEGYDWVVVYDTNLVELAATKNFLPEECWRVIDKWEGVVRHYRGKTSFLDSRLDAGEVDYRIGGPNNLTTPQNPAM